MPIDIDRIMKQSSKAICGSFEREVVIDADEVMAVKKLLKQKGQIIVGTGPAGFGKKKVWFNPAGMNL